MGPETQKAPEALTYEQKLEAMSLRFYQGMTWTPKAGDHYTTSRADLELYQVVSVDEGVVRTRYCDTSKSEELSSWPVDEFTAAGFGPKRVFVPDFVLSQQPASEITDDLSKDHLDALQEDLRHCAYNVTPDEANRAIKALRAKNERLEKSLQSLSSTNHRQALCINFTAGALGPECAATIDGLPKAAGHVAKLLAEADADAERLAGALSAERQFCQMITDEVGIEPRTTTFNVRAMPEGKIVAVRTLAEVAAETEQALTAHRAREEGQDV
ncbi:hypothetical protein JI664_21615 [Rhodobacter sp. NTK016B]|uniref:hypothetical protein n=1 Tax=Rhodobacter sp. NTK016B TaxID=2759676 RepID=UPI001A8C645B|nr:hypothetical protein [Rhodobacter sp. NTK016B]MBN8294586.1 hypothetical protein [Rhodobacter sp. NTK016B]